MIEAMNIVEKYLSRYYGDFAIFALTIIAFIYLLITNKNDRWRMLIPTGFIFICIVNPLLVFFMGGEYYYWRLFWILPNGIIIALGITKLIKSTRKILLKCIVLVVGVCTILGLGSNSFITSKYTKTDNAYKISQEAIDVCTIMLSVDDNPRCVAPKELLAEIRQYSGDIEMMYGRNVQGYINGLEEYDNEKIIYTEMSTKDPDYNKIFACSEYSDYNFVITNIDKEATDDEQEMSGYFEVGRTEKQIVYYKDFSDNTKWLITQHNANNEAEYTFYTIEDKDGHLIVIDGGNVWSKTQLQKVIEAKGNHVDAWIFTTPKNGHIGAFTKMMSEDNDISIDNIYLPNIDYNKYKSTLMEYEKIEYYDNFLETTKDMDNIHYLNIGDELDIYGLEIKVYNSWGENIDYRERFYANVGSLVFSVNGSSNAMLFLSDYYVWDYKLFNEQIKETKMKFDYVQVANHGENGAVIELYDQFTPKGICVDVNVSVIDNEDKRIKTEELIQYFRDRDIEIFSYDKTPNMFLLY